MAGDNIDKSAEFIFSDSKEKFEAKNNKKWGIMWKLKLKAYSQGITYYKKIQSEV